MTFPGSLSSPAYPTRRNANDPDDICTHVSLFFFLLPFYTAVQSRTTTTGCSPSLDVFPWMNNKETWKLFFVQGYNGTKCIVVFEIRPSIAFMSEIHIIHSSDATVSSTSVHLACLPLFRGEPSMEIIAKAFGSAILERVDNA